jgi:hypothetical protein
MYVNWKQILKITANYNTFMRKVEGKYIYFCIIV